jgi:hypothetical protein
MKKIIVKLQFQKRGYIGNPFWTERNMLINIGKDVHPKLQGDKREKAILAACDKRGVSPEQYQDLQAKAARPFYTINGARDGEIVIPDRVFHSFVNHASMVAPKAVPKISEKGLTFIAINIGGGHLRTGKTEKDSQVFSRPVKLEESNQRSLQEHLHIPEFIAEGVLELDESVVKSDDLQKLVEWGGKWVGVGSCRPQGFGRFTVITWDEV